MVLQVLGPPTKKNARMLQVTWKSRSTAAELYSCTASTDSQIQL